MLIRLIVAAFALGGAAVATPASAAKYLITYTGFVNSGYDKTGEFGAPNTDLTGLPYKAVYQLTTPIPPGVDTYTSSAVSWFKAYAAVPRPLTGGLTINGITKSLDGSWYSQDYQAYFNHGAIVDAEVGDASWVNSTISQGLLVNELYSDVHKFVTTSNYTDHLDYAVEPGDVTDNGYFFFSTYDYTYWYDPDKALVHSAQGHLTLEHVTISAASVPEPESWVMMLAGFGLIGVVVRRGTCGGRRYRRIEPLKRGLIS